MTIILTIVRASASHLDFDYYGSIMNSTDVPKYYYYQRQS